MNISNIIDDVHVISPTKVHVVSNTLFYIPDKRQFWQPSWLLRSVYSNGMRRKYAPSGILLIFKYVKISTTFHIKRFTAN